MENTVFTRANPYICTVIDTGVRVFISLIEYNYNVLHSIIGPTQVPDGKLEPHGVEANPHALHSALPTGAGGQQGEPGHTLPPHTGANSHHPQHIAQPPPPHPGSNLSSPHPPVSAPGPGGGEGAGHPPGQVTGPSPLHPAHSGPQRFPDPRQAYNPEQMAAVLPLMDTFNAIHNLGSYYY